MGFSYTDDQKRVLNARNHDILVSAAAGSGKTAVLVERIIRMISEPDAQGKRVDIDRLLVVTFTKAAAAQMRERIGKAVSERIEKNLENGNIEDNAHLQRQETLLHNAQITTIDSFCTFILRNNFSEIGLDPGFRQADQSESDLLKQDAMELTIEKQYQREEKEDFLRFVDCFCPSLPDAQIEEMVLSLYTKAMSHPWPKLWLEERRKDYGEKTKDELFKSQWFQEMLIALLDRLREIMESYDTMIETSKDTFGPVFYLDFMTRERDRFFTSIRPYLLEDASTFVKESKAEGIDAVLAEIKKTLAEAGSFEGLPKKNKKNMDGVDPDLQLRVKDLRDSAKKNLQGLIKAYPIDTSENILVTNEKMHAMVETLINVTEDFIEEYTQLKQDKNVIDFNDLEHMALEILCEPKGDEVIPKRAAIAYREYFHEIMIDEYQDSNDVQELLLGIIAREEGDHTNRFMVGDVKQSIYKFRLARPEIFMAKFHEYSPKGENQERIDLNQNFRSRKQVLDTANIISHAIMREEIGGVLYDDAVSLKLGAEYSDQQEDLYRSELLLLDEAGDSLASLGEDYVSDASEDADREEKKGSQDAEDAVSVAELTTRRKEALAIAGRIKEMVGALPIRGEDEEVHPAKFSDVVVLLRTANGWDEEFQSVFEKEGIPCYLESKTGYYAAEEVREVINYLRVLNNPRQDIALFGALRGYFGGFKEGDLASIRMEVKEGTLYEALISYDEEPLRSTLSESLRSKIAEFLSTLQSYRKKSLHASIYELMKMLVYETGYSEYMQALPGGAKRIANLKLLLYQAAGFEQTSYTGLFQFLRYMDMLRKREMDSGEANTQDEKADVVRIMTIHKSKGLEFPICFVAGMGKGFNTKDAKSSLLCDNEWGIGMDEVDLEHRVKSSTLRKKAIADRILRGNLGEELRVLYVAMTRAKEKLILSGSVKDYAKKAEQLTYMLDGWTESQLSISAIESASNFLDLVLMAAKLCELQGTESPFCITVGEDLTLSLQKLEDQSNMADRERELDRVLLEAKEGKYVDPDLAQRILSHFSYVYPHADLEELYTKTTVSELKKAAMHATDDTYEGSMENADGVSLYPEEVSVTPYFPKWIPMASAVAAGEEPSTATAGTAVGQDTAAGVAAGVAAGATGTTAGSAGTAGTHPAPLRGAARGTAIHGFMELFDYGRFTEPAKLQEQDISEYIKELQADGKLSEEESQAMTRSELMAFFGSSICKRMAMAYQDGTLRREQPFVMGVPARRLREDFPEDETILIQGIIDVFWIEDGQIVVADYKTDHVHKAEELVDRYKVQLDYYAEALSSMLELPVKEKIIYSFTLQQEIPLGD